MKIKIEIELGDALEIATFLHVVLNYRKPDTPAGLLHLNVIEELKKQILEAMVMQATGEDMLKAEIENKKRFGE